MSSGPIVPTAPPEAKADIAHAELAEKPPNAIEIDVNEEKRLLRKLDLRVLPPLALFYLLSFLDRVNIGNAKIQGLTTDLHMTGPSDYNIALFIFFIPYILFEIPSNILIKNLRPSTYLSSIMFLWGVCTIGQGLVRNLSGLIAMRFLLGLFEAGIVPGSVYLISMYYKRYELQWRLSLFFCASILAGAFGGLFAYALAHMNGIGGYGGWRWIFIIEGLLTVVIALALKPLVPDWPQTAKFLSPTERELLFHRLAHDSDIATTSNNAQMNTLNKRSLKRTFSDPKIYTATLIYLGVVNTGYSTSFFIPTIIQELGYTAEASQVRSIPIFCVAAVLALCTAYATDRLRHRFAFTIVGVVVGGIGYVVLLCQDGVSIGVRYMACFFIVSGGYITQPVAWSWLANNVSGHYKRAISLALQIGFGNLGGIVASNIFLSSQAPHYPVGYGVSLALLLMCGCLCCVFFWQLWRENRIRERGGRDHWVDEARAKGGEEEVGNMGDDWPGWRFVY